MFFFYYFLKDDWHLYNQKVIAPLMIDTTISWYRPKVQKNKKSLHGTQYMHNIINLFEFIYKLT
jgi:hypothetical protein